jgi:hypothetical protein
VRHLALRPRGRAAEEIDIATGTLDDPAAVPPQKHIWGEQKLDWVKLGDGLPMYAQSSAGPDAVLMTENP